jgi:rod shape-determining protein MreD
MIGPSSNPHARRQINRAHSPALAYAAPWLSVMLASALPGWLIIANLPVMPPFGYLVLLGWRQLRPGLLPAWAGLPLGFVDDLFSGQPIGSAVLLWSVTLLVLDAIELRWPWRNFWVEWAVAAGMIVTCLLLMTLIAQHGQALAFLPVVAPQLAISVLAYPLAGRLVAWLDRNRLHRWRVIG